MSFLQAAPALGNQYDDDDALRSLLQRLVPPDVLREIEPGLREMGALSGGKLYQMQLADRLAEPVLTQWSAWGERIDRIELTPLWREAERIAAEHGVVATAYEQRHGRFSRIHQFALAYLFTPSTDIYSCPLAMTDGAARVLLDSGNDELIRRAVPHLTSRDPAEFWTSGQWMTETIGGSDVGETETVARRDADGQWRLYGRKWFTSAATSQMALTLARPDGNEAGGRGLALFYLETGYGERLRGIQVDRLKDKLGTRKLPTAELILDGTPAVPVAGLTDGVRNIAPMLNITRTWNAISACALMRRGLALAEDYARKRRVFGKLLAEQPLHRDTLDGLDAEFRGALALTSRVAELIGRAETGEMDTTGERLLRVLTPIAKLTTARQAVAVTSECLEAFGGAGYVEDTGLPALLRDAQVLTIWEGTTNVLALDALRALAADGVADAVLSEAARCAAAAASSTVAPRAEQGRAALNRAFEWLRRTKGDTPAADAAVQAGARRFALTLGRSLELLLLDEHAARAPDPEDRRRGADAAERFAASEIDGIRSAGPR